MFTFSVVGSPGFSVPVPVAVKMIGTETPDEASEQVTVPDAALLVPVHPKPETLALVKTLLVHVTTTKSLADVSSNVMELVGGIGVD